MTKERPSKLNSERETRVLLEQIDKNVRTVAEQHGDIVKRLDKIESEVTSMKAAVWEIDTRLTRVEEKLDTSISQNEERFKKIETKLEIA